MAMDWGWGMGCCLDLETESGFPKDSVMVTDLAMATDWEWAKGCYLDSETVWGSQMDLAMAKDSA
jgi:hypothetical protein